MSARSLTLAAVLAMPGIGWSQTAANSQEKLTRIVYAVADLVVPVGGLDIPVGVRADSATKEDWLISKIQQSIARDSWDCAGGQGSIQYFPLSMSLVVNQSGPVQAQVADLLATMRCVQNVEVAVETRVLEVGAGVFAKLRALCPELRNGEMVQSDIGVLGMLALAQGDGASQILQAPKITGFQGQRVEITAPGLNAKYSTMVAGNLRHLDLNVQTKAGNVTFEKVTRLVDGATLVLSARNKNNGYTLLLVTPRIVVSPGEENLFLGALPPAPKTVTMGSSIEGIVQAGGTVVPPVAQLSQAAPAKSTPTRGRLEMMLDNYERACVAGDLALARKWARRALALDPTCFQKD